MNTSPGERGNALRIGIVATPRQWRSDLQAWITDHTVGVSIAVIREPGDISPTAFDVIVFDDVTQFVATDLVDRLKATGIAVVGVFDATGVDGMGRSQLERVGIDQLVGLPCAPADLLAAFEQAAEEGKGERGPTEVVKERRAKVDDQVGSLCAVVGHWQGAVVDVGAALASAFTAHGPTILVDVDDIDPGVASRFMLALSPNVVDYIRNGQGPRVLADSLGRHLRGARPLDFAVLCGMAKRRDWQELTAESIHGLLDETEAYWSRTVAICAPNWDRIPGAPQRGAATRAVLDRADSVVIVAEPDPVGALRALDRLADLLRISTPGEVTVVFYGRTRARFRRVELETHLRASAGPDVIDHVIFVPTGGALDKQRWNGAAPPKRLVRPLRSLAKPMRGRDVELARPSLPARSGTTGTVTKSSDTDSNSDAVDSDVEVVEAGEPAVGDDEQSATRTTSGRPPEKRSRPKPRTEELVSIDAGQDGSLSDLDEVRPESSTAHGEVIPEPENDPAEPAVAPAAVGGEWSEPPPAEDGVAWSKPAQPADEMRTRLLQLHNAVANERKQSRRRRTTVHSEDDESDLEHRNERTA